MRVYIRKRSSTPSSVQTIREIARDEISRSSQVHVNSGGSAVRIPNNQLPTDAPQNGVTVIDASSGTNTTYGTLTGAINGVNTDYTVSMAKYISGTLKVWLNGLLQLQGSDGDYEEMDPDSGTFRFVTAPLSGWIIAEYRF